MRWGWRRRKESRILRISARHQILSTKLPLKPPRFATSGFFLLIIEYLLRRPFVVNSDNPRGRQDYRDVVGTRSPSLVLFPAIISVLMNNSVFYMYSRSPPCIYFVLGESTMFIVTGERGAEWDVKSMVGHREVLDLLSISFSSFCASVFWVKMIRFFRELLAEHR